MTYEFLVLKKCKWGKKGDIVEATMSMSEYDAFKAKHVNTLERYIGSPPVLADSFGSISGSKLPAQFSNRLRQIESNYPGAKGMLDNSKFNQTKEW
jgi:hypothetical protein